MRRLFTFPAAGFLPHPMAQKDEYVMLEDGEELHHAKLMERVCTLSNQVQQLQCKVSVLVWIIVLVGASYVFGFSFSYYEHLSIEMQRKLKECLLLASIPIVAMLFTWFHIWLAIQMMFRPVEFLGLWQHGSSGIGVGWQGVIPRKAEKMARTSYKCSRPYLEKPRVWLERVDAKVLVNLTRCHLKQVIKEAMSRA
eukprot:3014015-Amphidinium_carterae.1